MTGRRLVLLAGLLLSGEAHAWAPPAPNAGGDAEALISRGLELRERGDDREALAQFQRAYALSKGPRALAQIALAEQALGHWVDAETHLGDATRRTDDPWIARNSALLGPALTEIQDHLGSLELSGGIPGAQVFLNGILAGTFPLPGPVRVQAGSVAVEVRAPGYLPVVRTVIVQARGLARESIVMIAANPVMPPPVPVAQIGSAAPGRAVAAVATNGTEGSSSSPSSSEPAWGARKKVALAVGAGAVVGLAVGTTFLLVQRGRADDFKNAGCTTADPVLSPDCQDRRDKANFASTASIAGFAGAAVLAGIGTFLFLSDGSAGPGKVALARATPFRCAPGALGASVSCLGEF
jgi:hypothetical protein